jgi:2-polyprenyl-3-methyl-5-hydroxy-6-metoxy-1,4-benzoquinol methylase
MHRQEGADMTQTEGRYFAAAAPFEAEDERLRLVEVYGDPITARHVEAIGVLPGWRCLEVGAGRGSIARMLAERVGPSGSVVAIDIDPRFLENLKAPNVEVRKHDILTDPLDGPYDFVHCRYVLEHVSEPAKALRHMVSALRLGGVLLAESTDALCFGPADDSSPNARDLQIVTTVLTEVLAASGVLDPFFGRKLLRLLTAAGLTSVRAEVHVDICRGGSEHARLLGMTLERVRGVVIRSGRLTEQEFDAGLRVLDDPRANVMSLGTVSAVGGRTR